MLDYQNNNQMKKTIYFLSLITLLSCSGSDDDVDIVKKPTTFEEAAIGQWVSQLTESIRMGLEVTSNDSSVYTSVGDTCFTQSFSNEGTTTIIRNTTSVLEGLTSNLPVSSVFSGEDLVLLRDAGVEYIDARSTYNLVGSIINFTLEYFAGEERVLLVSGTFTKQTFNKC